MQQLNELDIAEERCFMEARLVGRAPSPETLIGERVGRNNGAEEVHPPLRALGLATVDVEQSQRDGRGRNPRLGILVQARGGGQAVDERVGHVESVEGRAARAHLGGVVDEGLEGHVVGADLKFQIRLRIVGSPVDERLHDLVLVDRVVDPIALVVVEVGLVVRRKRDLDGALLVA